MNRATVILAAVLCAGGASGAAAQGCLKADDTAEVKITGTLVIVKFKHPGNGSNLQAYVVRLPKPVRMMQMDLDAVCGLDLLRRGERRHVQQFVKFHGSTVSRVVFDSP